MDFNGAAEQQLCPTESPLKELNIGFAPFVLKSPISLMTENS
jgi:hypothetical protein